MELRQQRLSALDRANAIRFARAGFKRRLARGETTVAEVLGDVPDWAASWQIGEALISQQFWGEVRARKLLAEFRVSTTRTIGGLTVRQRQAIARRCEQRERGGR